jgi:hypothetical protein
MVKKNIINIGGLEEAEERYKLLKEKIKSSKISN